MSVPASRVEHPRTALVGSETLLAAWAERAGEDTGVVAIAATDLASAIDTIGDAGAEIVVIEQAIAGDGEGFALMEHLLGERLLHGTEVRLLTAERAADLMSSGPGDLHPQAWLSVLADALPPRPERRAARFRASQDEQALIDGQPVALIDLSSSGLQVRSSMVLRPRQRVRLVLPPHRGNVRTSAIVVWSQFEMNGAGYRAGIAFTAAIPDLEEPLAGT